MNDSEHFSLREIINLKSNVAPVETERAPEFFDIYLFCELYNSGTIKAAMIKTGKSRYIISGRLKKMRHQFGDPLFIHCDGKQLEPTEKAISIYTKIRDSLDFFFNNEVNDVTGTLARKREG